MGGWMDGWVDGLTNRFEFQKVKKTLISNLIEETNFQQFVMRFTYLETSSNYIEDSNTLRPIILSVIQMYGIQIFIETRLVRPAELDHLNTEYLHGPL